VVSTFINAKANSKLSKALFINDIKCFRNDIRSFKLAIAYLINCQAYLLNDEGCFKKEEVK